MGTEYTLYKVNKPEYYDLGKHLYNLDYMALLNSGGFKEAKATKKWDRKPFNLRKAWESFAAFYDIVLVNEVTGPDPKQTVKAAARALWDWAKDDDLILLSDDEDGKAIQAHYLQTSGHTLNCGGQFFIYKEQLVKPAPLTLDDVVKQSNLAAKRLSEMLEEKQKEYEEKIGKEVDYPLLYNERDKIVAKWLRETLETYPRIDWINIERWENPILFTVVFSIHSEGMVANNRTFQHSNIPKR